MKIMKKLKIKNQRGYSLIGLWPCYGTYIGLISIATPILGFAASALSISVLFFSVAAYVAHKHPEISALNEPLLVPVQSQVTPTNEIKINNTTPKIALHAA